MKKPTDVEMKKAKEFLYDYGCPAWTTIEDYHDLGACEGDPVDDVECTEADAINCWVRVIRKRKL